MHYVYLIRSISNPNQTYIGLTDDLKSRLNKHNEGGSAHTSKYKPWKLAWYPGGRSSLSGSGCTKVGGLPND